MKIADVFLSQPPETWIKGRMTNNKGSYCQLGWFVKRVFGTTDVLNSELRAVFHLPIGLVEPLITNANDTARTLDKAKENIIQQLQWLGIADREVEVVE